MARHAGGSAFGHDWCLTGFGRAVRQLREQRHISAGDLATAVGVTRRGLAAIEAGQSDTPFDIMVALADALAIAPGELMRQAEKEWAHAAAETPKPASG